MWSIIAALGLGIPVGGVIAMALTPLLWRLEPILHIELAGHSGPSDWVILTIIAITVLALALLFGRIFCRRPNV